MQPERPLGGIYGQSRCSQNSGSPPSPPRCWGEASRAAEGGQAGGGRAPRNGGAVGARRGDRGGTVRVSLCPTGTRGSRNQLQTPRACARVRANVQIDPKGPAFTFRIELYNKLIRKNKNETGTETVRRESSYRAYITARPWGGAHKFSAKVFSHSTTQITSPACWRCLSKPSVFTDWNLLAPYLLTETSLFRGRAPGTAPRGCTRQGRTPSFLSVLR